MCVLALSPTISTCDYIWIFLRSHYLCYARKLVKENWNDTSKNKTRNKNERNVIAPLSTNMHNYRKFSTKCWRVRVWTSCFSVDELETKPVTIAIIVMPTTTKPARISTETNHYFPCRDILSFTCFFIMIFYFLCRSVIW